MKKKRNQVQLGLRGRDLPFTISLTSDGRLTSFIGRKTTGVLPVENTKTRIIFKLSEIVQLERYSKQYRVGSHWNEVSSLKVTIGGKSSGFRFSQSASLPVIPEYLRLLVNELHGLLKW